MGGLRQGFVGEIELPLPLDRRGLIFFDIHRPFVGGFEFLETYQRLLLARQHGIVIVMLTTALHPTDGQRANRLPVAGFRTKSPPVEKGAWVLADHFFGSPRSLYSGPGNTAMKTGRPDGLLVSIPRHHPICARYVKSSQWPETPSQSNRIKTLC